MAKYKVKEILSKDIWERFVLSQNPKSFLQSWNWGETNKLMGDKIFRLGFFEGEKLVGVCLLIKQKAKRGSHFLVPGGPIINWSDKSLLEFVIKAIKNLAKKEHVWFARIRLELFDTKENKMIFRKLGFVSSPMHLHAENTWVLDIDKEDEDLLMAMRKNTRYLIRKSQKMNLSFYETTDVRASGILKKLQDETVARLKFVGFPEKLFKFQLETFGKDNQARLFTCNKNRETLVAAIIIFYGKYAYYHHSGSSSKHREIPSSYFLQWNIIKEAKKRECKFYNFWGIAPEGSMKHRFSGVTTFKKGFGGERVNWLHAQDLPISPLYWTTYLFETIRKISRGL